MLIRTILNAMAGLSVAAAAAHSEIIHTFFSSDDEGWRVVELANQPETSGYSSILSGPLLVEFVPIGGLEGGAIRKVDPGPNANFYFSAPADYLGSKLSYYGGTLSFALRHTLDGTQPFGSIGDVVLIGAGRTLVVDAGPEPAGCTGWTPCVVGLTETSGWHTDTLSGPQPSVDDFRSVLSDLTAMYIRGEFFVGEDDCYLDSVEMIDGTGKPLELALRFYAGLVIEGTIGRTYRVDYANVLDGTTNWITLTNLTILSPQQMFIDLESPDHPRRFYRAVEAH